MLKTKKAKSKAKAVTAKAAKPKIKAKPKTKTKAKPKTKAVAAKPAVVKSKPAKVETKSAEPQVRLPGAAAAAPEQQAQPIHPTGTPKIEPPHPGKQEQPMWVRFNQGHNQKMPKGRPFRHQGR